MKLKLFSYNRVKSTNSSAINLIKRKNFKSGLVHAITQTQGRGRYGRNWISKKGNLFVSVFFEINNDYPSTNKLTLINALVVLNVLKKVCKKKEIKFKKPNDIYLNRKKICGILQEIISVKNRKYLIVGIGINLINNPKLNKYVSTNIFKETNIKLDMIKILKILSLNYEKFLNHNNKKKYLEVIKKSKLIKI